jgi:hypothetical protein
MNLELEVRYLMQHFNTGLRQIYSEGDRTTRPGALVYGYADRNFRIYELVQKYPSFRGIYHQVAHEAIYDRFRELPFIELKDTASIYTNKTNWEIMAQFRCKTFPKVIVEIKNVVVFSRDNKSPEGSYTLFTIYNFAAYPDLIKRLRSKPAEHELVNLDKRITEALEALH